MPDLCIFGEIQSLPHLKEFVTNDVSLNKLKDINFKPFCKCCVYQKKKFLHCRFLISFLHKVTTSFLFLVWAPCLLFIYLFPNFMRYSKSQMELHQNMLQSFKNVKEVSISALSKALIFRLKVHFWRLKK